MTKQEISMPSPAARAEEFRAILSLINRPSTTPFEEAMEQRTGGIFRAFVPSYMRVVPQELANTILARARGVFAGLPVTNAGVDHVIRHIDQQLNSGMMRMIGTDFILDACGINIEKGEYGLLDPVTAVETERQMIIVNRPNPYIIPELALEHNEQMQQWINQFNEKHPDNPVQI